MSKSIWITPEEVKRKKRIKKKVLYVSFLFFTVLLSAMVTILASKV
ncbi:MAG: hypothetical protein ACQEXE_16510 [Bacillota bacterium]|nr:hypothetical protein [Cytobacillus firmus]